MNPSPPAARRSYWPHAIIGFFAVFITWTIGFIIFSTFHRVDLVSPDYYDRELRYQEQIDRRARTQAMESGVRIDFNAAQQLITISLPQNHALQKPTGQIHLYRPSAAGQDQKRPLDLTSSGQQTIGTSALSTGLWRVNVSWVVNELEYFHSQEILLGKNPSS